MSPVIDNLYIPLCVQKEASVALLFWNTSVVRSESGNSACVVH